MKQMRLDHQQHTIQKTHNYSTRNKTQMNLPAAKSSSYRSSFLFKGLRDYQLLPADIKQEVHGTQFLNKCKQHLMT